MPNNKLALPSIGLMVVGMVAPPSGSGAQVPSFVRKRRDLPPDDGTSRARLSCDFETYGRKL
jgi:hypothetical protein